MDRHSIVLRAADPTFDGCPAFAGYLDEAAEGFLSFMLGRRAGYITAAAFAKSEAIGYTRIKVLSNDKRALSFQRGPSLMAYLGMIRAE